MQYDAIIIGASIIDIPAGPVDASLFAIGSVPVERLVMQVGGDAINEATVLAHKGAKVKLISKISDDLGGEFILRHCREYQIDSSDFIIDPAIDTSINVVLVEPSGERSFITSNRGGMRQLKPQDIPFQVFRQARLLCFASIFVFPFFKTADLLLLFQAAKKQGLILCADMTKCKNRETIADLAAALCYLDYIFPNYEEAKMLTQKEDIDEIADAFLNCGVKHVVIKLGTAGCLIKTVSQRYLVPACPDIACLDTTGAGDNFAAGFIDGILHGCSLVECGRRAHQTAAKSIQHMGATTWIKAGS